MSQDYIFNIAADIYGGFFNGNSSSVLTTLSKFLIPDTALLNITTNVTTVTLTYENTLSPAEKTALDGNTSAPAGGIVGRCNDYLEFTFDSISVDPNFPLPPVFLLSASYFLSIPTITPVSNVPVLVITADGSTTFDLGVKYFRGDGVATSGYGNTIDLWADSIITTGADYGTLDSQGQFSIRVGPSFDQGTVTITAYAYFLQPITIPVKFFSTESL